ncbi:MAG: sigma-70 region 4 domain-containing protein [Oscillospiraceae bacterium]|jgi:hypothetical protein|nr:sigma-70 region 4 domain-containing protein [Oscillospiraceae bacterium]
MKRRLEDVDPERNFRQWADLIDEWIFSEEDRKILKRHYLDGISYGDLSEEFCLDIDTIKKRIYKAQKRLFEHL